MLDTSDIHLSRLEALARRHVGMLVVTQQDLARAGQVGRPNDIHPIDDEPQAHGGGAPPQLADQAVLIGVADLPAKTLLHRPDPCLRHSVRKPLTPVLIRSAFR